ncbi:hypothetical protein RhiirB3_532600 [Rhizophagus irregularis]|nr:hypothetical protein RhiirB3_532600 [Rhizophagus irregularis]
METQDNTNIRSSISTNNDESNTNDNELTLRNTGMVAPLSSTIFYPSITNIENDLKTSRVLANGIIGVNVFFMGVAELQYVVYQIAFGYC